jgi:hypothetical protein
MNSIRAAWVGFITSIGFIPPRQGPDYTTEICQGCGGKGKVTVVHYQYFRRPSFPRPLASYQLIKCPICHGVKNYFYEHVHIEEYEPLHGHLLTGSRKWINVSGMWDTVGWVHGYEMSDFWRTRIRGLA